MTLVHDTSILEVFESACFEPIIDASNRQFTITVIGAKTAYHVPRTMFVLQYGLFRYIKSLQLIILITNRTTIGNRS